MSTPSFSDFGKSIKDLLENSYKYKHTLKTVNKATGGLTLESGLKNLGADVDGYGKVSFKSSDYESEVELHSTEVDKDTKAKVTLKSLFDGLKVVVSGSAVPEGAVQAKYKYDFFTGDLKLGGKLTKKDTVATTLSGSGAISTDGIAVGGNFKLDLSEGKPAFKQADVGIQYAQSDATVAIKTETKNCKKTKKDYQLIVASLFYQASDSTQVGFKVDWNTETSKKKGIAGFQYKLDKSTTLKSTIDTTGILSTAVVTKLKNPNVQFGVASQFDSTKKDFKASKYGLEMKFSS